MLWLAASAPACYTTSKTMGPRPLSNGVSMLMLFERGVQRFTKKVRSRLDEVAA